MVDGRDQLGDVWEPLKWGGRLIRFVREEEKRKIYVITDLGRTVLEIELKRIERLYTNSRGGYWNE